ncbi:MAG: hypothetical protein ACTHOD_19710 [Motilibacteraceae bacterium]
MSTQVSGGSLRQGWRRVALALLVPLAAMLVAGTGFLLGRLSSGHGPSRGYEQGYRAGLDVGQSEGIEQGRALQLGLSVPPSSRSAAQRAFEAGYAAGANDIFGTYDGGWAFGRPYLVVLEPGEHGLTYRIARREELRPSASTGP